MAKYKPSNENQMIMIPISLQDQLVDENINLSVFDERYKNDETGAAAIHPKILLKVILLAYAKGMISSRQIERACHEMKAKIDSEQGKKIYARRLAIVEPVFANICVHKHMCTVF